jgi:hypothetical protein
MSMLTVANGYEKWLPGFGRKLRIDRGERRLRGVGLANDGGLSIGAL